MLSYAIRHSIVWKVCWWINNLGIRSHHGPINEIVVSNQFDVIRCHVIENRLDCDMVHCLVIGITLEVQAVYCLRSCQSSLAGWCRSEIRAASIIILDQTVRSKVMDKDCVEVCLGYAQRYCVIGIHFVEWVEHHARGWASVDFDRKLKEACARCLIEHVAVGDVSSKCIALRLILIICVS